MGTGASLTSTHFIHV